MLVSCPRCSGTLNSDSEICPHCGLTNYPTTPVPIGRRCRLRSLGQMLSKRRALTLQNFHKRPQYRFR